MSDPSTKILIYVSFVFLDMNQKHGFSFDVPIFALSKFQSEDLGLDEQS